MGGLDSAQGLVTVDDAAVSVDSRPIGSPSHCKKGNFQVGRNFEQPNLNVRHVDSLAAQVGRSASSLTWLWPLIQVYKLKLYAVTFRTTLE
jgi:hypothetical protein